ncbi:hypothetical protein [Streptomyces zhihengii]|uniref:hypothetical protein n=1 Tax=Streptomyces zhihengii TaxID=1818004 RepID=UPI0033B70323
MGVDGVEAVAVSGLPSLVADLMAAITDEDKRGRAAEVLVRHTLTLVRLPGEAGQARTTYAGEVDGVPVTGILAAGERLRRLIRLAPKPTCPSQINVGRVLVSSCRRGGHPDAVITPATARSWHPRHPLPVYGPVNRASRDRA